MIGAPAIQNLESDSPERLPVIPNVCEDLSVSETVDGRNPAPIEKYFIPLLTRFYTFQVVQDFFHQQKDSWI